MKYTQNTWIAEAKKKYGDRFSYEFTKYVDSYHKVQIKCNEHNRVFEAPPMTFIRSTSEEEFCPQCREEKESEITGAMEKIIDKWGELYSIETEKIDSLRDPLLLRCEEHGTFMVTAYRLLHFPLQILCPHCRDDIAPGISATNLNYMNSPEEKNKPGIYNEILFTHIPSDINFIKAGIVSVDYVHYDFSKLTDFKHQLLSETHSVMQDAAVRENNYKERKEHRRLILPAYVEFPWRSKCYMPEDVVQLKASQVKFIRDGLLLKQNGVCAICGKSTEMPTLDHYHSAKHHGSGLVRGVLCTQCNRLVGVIENNLSRNGIDFSDAPGVLHNIADYVMMEKTPFIHPSEKMKAKKLRKSSYNYLKRSYKGKAKFPPYPKCGKMNAKLKRLFETCEIIPEFYK